MTKSLIISESAKDAQQEMFQAMQDDYGLTDSRQLQIIQTAIDIEKAKAVAELKATVIELDRQVTLNRNNWAMDVEEKDRNFYKMLSERDMLSDTLTKAKAWIDEAKEVIAKAATERDELKRQNAELAKALESASHAIYTVESLVDKNTKERIKSALASTPERKI